MISGIDMALWDVLGKFIWQEQSGVGRSDGHSEHRWTDWHGDGH